MNADLITKAMGELDLKYVDEAAAYTRPRRRRVLRLAVAIVAAALLLGAGTVGVASTVYGRNLGDVLRLLWQEETGETMRDEQAAIITGMVQEVGVSRSAGGVTATVTSARVSDRSIWLLLRMEGEALNGCGGLIAQELALSVDGKVVDNSSTGLEYIGLDGDGAQLYMVHYSAPEPGQNWDSNLDVELKLGDLATGLYPEEIVVPGDWSMSFGLDYVPETDSIALADATVRVYDRTREEHVDARLTQIVVTSTGFSFNCDVDPEHSGFDVCLVEAVVGDGSASYPGLAYTAANPDGATWSVSGEWRFPLDLQDIRALRVNMCTIPVR